MASILQIWLEQKRDKNRFSYLKYQKGFPLLLANYWLQFLSLYAGFYEKPLHILAKIDKDTFVYGKLHNYQLPEMKYIPKYCWYLCTTLKSIFPSLVKIYSQSCELTFLEGFSQ